MHLILILFLLHTTTKMTELTPWEALKNGRGTRGVRKSWAEERSSGGKLTKAAAEQRAAGDNNHYNETVVSLLKYLCTENSPSQCMSTEDNLPFQHQPLLGKVFTFSYEMQAFHNWRRDQSENWANKATLWNQERSEGLATVRGVFWSRLAAFGGPTASRARYQQTNYLLLG